METTEDSILTAYVNGDITAIRLIESIPQKEELYNSFLRTMNLPKNEESAKAYLEYEEEMGISSPAFF